MKKVSDIRTVVKCCSLYYEENLNQKEIAQQLGISRPTVSRILKDAQKQGIIKIEIINPLETDYCELERKIEKAFKLKEVIITDNKNDEIAQKQELAKHTAKYLERVIKDGDIIGVTFGSTIKEIPKYTYEQNINATFIPLIGGVGQLDIEEHSNQIVVNLAKKYGSDCKLLHTPAVVSDIETKQKIIQDEKTKEVINMIDRINIAIVGIGNPMSIDDTIAQSGYMDKNEIKEFRKYKLKGAICMQAFDNEGKTYDLKFNKKVIGIEIEKLKQVNRTIGVACGKEKIEAIEASLNCGFINTLVTNYETANELINRYYIK